MKLIKLMLILCLSMGVQACNEGGSSINQNIDGVYHIPEVFYDNGEFTPERLLIFKNGSVTEFSVHNNEVIIDTNATYSISGSQLTLKSNTPDQSYSYICGGESVETDFDDETVIMNVSKQNNDLVVNFDGEQFVLKEATEEQIERITNLLECAPL